MTGIELLAALEREGFAIVRRSQSYVWIGRGKDVLLLDPSAEVDDDVAKRLIERARQPPP
jgi:crotonobetainyl-CoA:carnitine CoA-transferase CaiB-like acyl-CoA transferase